MLSPVIELKNITKTYVERSWRTFFLNRELKRVHALKDVSLDVGQGEVFGILGPNGAGKTTLIKILATLIIPDSGSAKICGYDSGDRPDRVRETIGLVNTNERSFYWRLTGRQNLDFFAALYDLSDSDRDDRVEELLNLVGLNEKAESYFMNYSAGQRQRLAIARALLADPMVILMDEPANSLDPIAAAEFLKFVRNELIVQKGKTVLWCTHNLREAEEVCDRLAVIDQGRVVAAGSLEDMRSVIDDVSLYKIRIDYCSEDILKQVGINPIRSFRENEFLELELNAREDDIPIYIEILVRSGVKVYGCGRGKIELEEIFAKLTVEGRRGEKF